MQLIKTAPPTYGPHTMHCGRPISAWSPYWYPQRNASMWCSVPTFCADIRTDFLCSESIHIATPVFALANADEWSALLIPCNSGVFRQTVVILPVSVSLSLSMLYILCAARHATSARMPSRRRLAHTVLTTASSFPAMHTSQSTQRCTYVSVYYVACSDVMILAASPAQYCCTCTSSGCKHNITNAHHLDLTWSAFQHPTADDALQPRRRPRTIRTRCPVADPAAT